jgi:hypothetical protein
LDLKGVALVIVRRVEKLACQRRHLPHPVLLPVLDLTRLPHRRSEFVVEMLRADDRELVLDL